MTDNETNETNDQPTGIVNATKDELAALLGVSKATIGVYCDSGMPGRTGRSSATRYNVGLAIAFHVEHRVRQALADQLKNPPDLDGIPELETSERLIAHYKAERERMRVAKESGDLIAVDVSRREIEHKLSQIRGALDSLPGSFAPFVVGLTSLEQAQRVLSRELQTLYGTLSNLPDFENDEIEPNDETTEE